MRLRLHRNFRNFLKKLNNNNKGILQTRMPLLIVSSPLMKQGREESYLFIARATLTAHATVQPTIGLLPMPRKPIIST